MASAFYRYRERDLISVPAHELEPGDEIALYCDMKYGTIPIETVTKPRGTGSILIEYDLPKGAIMHSDDTTEISVFWEGSRPLIQIYQHIKPTDRIMIRRK